MKQGSEISLRFAESRSGVSPGSDCALCALTLLLLRLPPLALPNHRSIPNPVVLCARGPAQQSHRPRRRAGEAGHSAQCTPSRDKRLAGGGRAGAHGRSRTVVHGAIRCTTTVMHQGAGAHRSWCTVVHGAIRCPAAGMHLGAWCTSVHGGARRAKMRCSCGF